MLKKIPALSEDKRLRYFNFIVLYVAQGIPEGMAFFGIPAWMAMHGKSPGEIAGFVAAVGLPWSFKLLVAPLMDRFSFLPMGRRRPWVLVGQAGLIAAFISMAFVPDPLNNLPLLMAAGFAVGFFGAFQDVATDGMAIDIIPLDQQAKANGFMWGAKIIGTSFSLALGSWLLNRYNYQVAVLSLSVLVGLIMLVPVFLRERPGEKLLPWSQGVASPESRKMQLSGWAIIFKSIYRVIRLRNSLLLAVILFLTQGSYNYIDTLLPIFTVQSLGWTDQEYSQIFATASLTGGIIGMLIGGFLIDRFGKIRMMNVYYMLLIALTCGFVIFKSFWTSYWYLAAYMMIYQVLYVFACICIFAVAMECCWKKISASQFTIFMTIGNLGRTTGVKLIGPAKEQFNWEGAILLFAGFILLSWIVIQFIHVPNHLKHIEELDLRHSEVEKKPIVV